MLLDLLETFDYTTTISWNDEVGTFEVDNQQFIVRVRPARRDEQQTFTPFFKDLPKVGNVDFSRILPDGMLTQDTTGLSGRSSLKVFSVIAQAVQEQIKTHGYDVLLCIAKKRASPTNFEKRVEAYQMIIDRASRKFNLFSMKLIETSKEVVFVLYTNNKFSDGLIKIQQHMRRVS
jgi:hypothetical protein